MDESTLRVTLKPVFIMPFILLVPLGWAVGVAVTAQRAVLKSPGLKQTQSYFFASFLCPSSSSKWFNGEKLG